jgi:hypothetical protein
MAPESECPVSGWERKTKRTGPWWLARMGRKEEAKRSIARTARPGHFSEEDLDAQLALIDHTHQLEAMETKNASLFNCFKGTNLRRVEIVSRNGGVGGPQLTVVVLRRLVCPVLVRSADDWVLKLLVCIFSAWTTAPR